MAPKLAFDGFKWPFGTIWSHLEPFGAFVGAILRSQPETLAVYTFYTLFYTFHSNLIVVLQMTSKMDESHNYARIKDVKDVLEHSTPEKDVLEHPT